MTSRPSRGRRLLGKIRRRHWPQGSKSEAAGRTISAFDEDAPRPTEAAPAGVGWDLSPAEATGGERLGAGREDIRAQILSLIADPRLDGLTASAAARALGHPAVDVETAMDAMVQAGELTRSAGVNKQYRVTPENKEQLEAMFCDAANELGEAGVLVRTAGLNEDALVSLDDEAEEPRLPVTAGLLSLFLPGTGQLLNGDVGRASLVFAVWALAWITQLSPVWTFVCLYAAAEAFFTAKIRSMERKLAKDATAGADGAAQHALPPGNASQT